MPDITIPTTTPVKLESGVVYTLMHTGGNAVNTDVSISSDKGGTLLITNTSIDAVLATGDSCFNRVFNIGAIPTNTVTVVATEAVKETTFLFQAKTATPEATESVQTTPGATYQVEFPNEEAPLDLMVAVYETDADGEVIWHKGLKKGDTFVAATATVVTPANVTLTELLTVTQASN